MERRILQNTTPTLVGYPRLQPGEFRQAQPTGTPTAKIRTPATPAPAAANAEIDSVSTTLTTAAAAGATEVVVADALDEDFDVAAVRLLIVAELEIFGISNGDATADAVILVVARRTVAEFTDAIEALRPTIDIQAGAATSDAEIAAIVDVYEAAVTAPPLWVGGRRYLLADDGYVFVVESRASGRSSTLRLAEPLLEAVGVGATVQGFAVLAEVDAVASADVGDASVEWTATVEGEEVAWVDLFRIVVRIPKSTLTPGKLLKLRPIMRSLQLPTDTTLEDVIAGAWEGRMLPLLENKGVFDEDIVSDENLAPLHALACVLHIIEDDARADRAFVADVREQFSKLEDVTFRRVSHDEQGQTQTEPRDRGIDEDRGVSLRVTR